jgi:hypothetical protein
MILDLHNIALINLATCKVQKQVSRIYRHDVLYRAIPNERFREVKQASVPCDSYQPIWLYDYAGNKCLMFRNYVGNVAILYREFRFDNPYSQDIREFLRLNPAPNLGLSYFYPLLLIPLKNTNSTLATIASFYC